MATVLPDLRGHKLPKSIAPVCSRLKQINCDELVCRLALPVSGQRLPEFFLLYQNRYAFLVSVSMMGSEDMTKQLEGDLFEKSNDQLFRDEFGLRERQLLDSCFELLASQVGVGAAGLTHVSKWVIFPYASQAVLDQAIQVLNDQRYTMVAKEGCTPKALLERIQKDSWAPASEEVVHLMREVYHGAELKKSPVTLKAREQGSVSGEGSLQRDIFLDLNQECLVKVDLDLSVEGRAVLEQGSRLITGTAGSGKSVILLHRAKLLAQLDRGSRILVLTHNRPLNSYLTSRFSELHTEGNQVEWKTFFSWIAGQRWTKPSICSEYQRNSLINKILSDSKLRGRLTARFLAREFDWIADNDVGDRATYLEITRAGRKRGLARGVRAYVYDCYEVYQRVLTERVETDWSGFAQLFLRALRRGKVSLPQYDAILIDEAQFFVPTWFECVRIALKPEGQLFMAADPTQGFLGCGQSWQSVAGLNVRGKSHTLEQPYRNTREILEFAKRFYNSRVPADDETINLPGSGATLQLPQGRTPQLVHFQSLQGQAGWIAGQIQATLTRGSLRAGQILVLHHESNQIENIVKLLNGDNEGIAVNAKTAESLDKVRVCSINAATGLEAPLVFILGIDSIFEAEDSLLLDPADKPELILMNTRKLYMALTRAMEHLVICFQRMETKRALLGDHPHVDRD